MIINKWFGNRGAVSAQVQDALAELAKLTQPSLATAVEVLRDIVLELFTGDGSNCRAEASDRSSLAGDSKDHPLLRGRPLTLDMKPLRRRWLAVCKAIARQNSDAQAVAAAFAKLDAGTLLKEVLAGRPEAVHAKAEELDLDPALTATVLRFVALPILAAQLASLRPQAQWEHGMCPACGSWPLLGEFRGLEQTRFLRCGLCASAWEFPRLRCPFCGNHDHHQLGFFHVEGEENRYRAATCDECHGYVKMVSTLGPLSEPHLLVADLATLHLDLAAADRGYWVP